MASNFIQTDASPIFASQEQRNVEEHSKDEFNENEFIEKVRVYPSTELIPDEYENEKFSDIFVNIFYNDNDDNQKTSVKLIKEHFKNYLSYEIPDNDIHATDTSVNVKNTLFYIAQREDLENFSGILIIYLVKITDDEQHDKFPLGNDPNDIITTKDVWSHFTSKVCKGLDGKPKIFMFLPVKPQTFVESDGKKSPFSQYEIPPVADMLIVYLKSYSNSERLEFVEQLLKNIKVDGERDDIVDIIAQTKPKNKPRFSVLTISTLTRKLFSYKSEHRGYRYDLAKSDLDIEKKMEELEKILNTKKKTVKRNPSIIGKLSSSSFKRITETVSTNKTEPSPVLKHKIVSEKLLVQTDSSSKTYTNIKKISTQYNEKSCTKKTSVIRSKKTVAPKVDTGLKRNRTETNSVADNTRMATRKNVSDLAPKVKKESDQK